MNNRIDQESARLIFCLEPDRSSAGRCKSMVFFVVFTVSVGMWHAGSSSAQAPLEQPPVSYAIYSAPAYISTSSVSGPSTRNWALDVANAQTNLNSDRLPDIGVARQRLDQAMNELENFLATSPQHQADWLAFLNWTDLREQISSPAPDPKSLVQIEKNFRQNYFGLEMSKFTNVRDALKSYTHALRFSSNRPQTIAILKDRLTKLSEQLQMPQFSQDFANTRDIGQMIANLSQSNQSTDLVNAVRGNYSRANARVLISSEFLTQKFTKPVYEPNPVDEVILGTQLIGQSVMQGFVTPQLLDSSSNAALRLNLSGNFSSQNIGYNRSVKLHTQGYGTVSASETIALTDHGLVTLNDTSVDAGLSSQIDSIEAKLRIVRKIAAKQAAKQKPEADAIAEGRLETRLRDQFHRQLSQQVLQANEKIKTPDLPVLRRLGLEQPTRITWSSPQYLALLWKVQDGPQLAAPVSCPLVVEPNGITVQLHESVITNITDPILAGRILRNTEMESFAAQFADVLGSKPVVKPQDDQPWALTFENYHPVEVQLDDSLVTFRIRTTKLDRGDQVVDQDASIEASYRVTLIDGAIQLDRQGEVKIDFTGKQQRGVRAASLRNLLKKQFVDVFKEQLLDTPLRVTDRLPSELQGLQLTSVQVDDGWIQAHLR